LTRDVIVTLAVLGVVGQVVLVLLAVLAILALVGIRGPLELVRETLWGYELWLVFAVAAIATAGSLFLSESANFPPCKLCWFQRIFMFPLAVTSLLAAVFDDRRAARYLLPLPLIGLGISVYHVLVERGVVDETSSCQISSPGGCGVKWVEEFGYVTIPTLAATAFLLVTVLLVLAAMPPRNEDDAGAKLVA
jgi:disulfide bond formation protein DsbB